MGGGLVRAKDSERCRRGEDMGNEYRAQLQDGGRQLSAGQGDFSLCVWHEEVVPFLLSKRAVS